MRSALPPRACRNAPPRGYERLEVLRRARVEANLQQLQPVVIVLPKEILDARVEQTHRHPRWNDIGAAGDVRRERNRRKLSGYVREALLPLRARGDMTERAKDVGRSHGQAGDRIDGGNRDGPAQGRLGAATRLAERAYPHGVAAGRERERRRPVSPVLVQHREVAWAEENLRGRLGVARPEGHEDDVAVAIHVLILGVRDADDVEIEVRSAGSAVAGLRGDDGGPTQHGAQGSRQVERGAHVDPLDGAVTATSLAGSRRQNGRQRCFAGGPASDGGGEPAVAP